MLDNNFKVSPQTMANFSKYSDKTLKIIKTLMIIISIPIGLLGLILLIGGSVGIGFFAIIICLLFAFPVPIQYTKVIRQRQSKEWQEYEQANPLSNKTSKKDFLYSNNPLREYYKTSVCSGLPVPAGNSCNLYLRQSNILLETVGTKYTINAEQVISVMVDKSEIIEKAVASSIGRAVAGAALFGTVGAMVGGRVKTHDIKTTKIFFSIVYKDKNNDIKSIVLEPRPSDVYNLKASSQRYNKLFADNNSVEL